MRTRGSRALLLAAALASSSLAACGPASHRSERAGAPPDTARRAARADTSARRGSRADSLAARRYLRYALVDPASIVDLQRTWGDSGLAIILKINRVDIDHARVGDTLVVPTSARPMLAWTPFPRDLPEARAVSRLLLVSARVQAFAAYDSGRLARWGPVSSGRREMPTPPALYHANWKARTHVSTVDEGWILDWYVNLDNFAGISLHQYELPGRPASHSCVRLREDDARWIYEWVRTWKVAPDRRHILEQGTPVVVFGEYRWSEVRPWKRLAEDPAATDVSGAEIAAALRRFAVPGVTGTPGSVPPTGRAPDPGGIGGP
jgi:lipoprotein-anchoring transpeptidase ErfK/SrfK